MGTIRVAGLVSDSIVDGPGIRYAIFTQGCGHNCLGCHNPATHDFNSGVDINIDKLIKRNMVFFLELQIRNSTPIHSIFLFIIKLVFMIRFI